jgi:uncharacterized protein YeaO (DUF488 family)
MAVSVVRLGSPRAANEGPRLGTVRRPPRGVKKAEFASRGFYDVWLPDLAPTQELLAWALAEPLTGARWAAFAKKYRAEMKSQERLIALLALLSKQTHFAVGCYCENPAQCHRTVLRELLVEAGADVR